MLSLGVSRAQTGVKKKTLDPLWNERLFLDADFFSEARHSRPPTPPTAFFPFEDSTFDQYGAREKQELVVELFDYDAFGANDFLGRVRVPVAHLHGEEEEEDDLWLPLAGAPRAPGPASLSTRGPTPRFPGQRHKLICRSAPAWPSRERARRRVRQGRAAHQAPPRPGRARRRRHPAGARTGAPLDSSAVRRRRRRRRGSGRAGAAAHGGASAGVGWAEVRGQARAPPPSSSSLFRA